MGAIGQEIRASIHLSADDIGKPAACDEADWPYMHAKLAHFPSRKVFKSADGLRLKGAFFLENWDLDPSRVL